MSNSDEPLSGPRRHWAVWTVAVLLLGVSAFHFGASAWRSQSTGIVDFPIFAEHAADYFETGVLYPRFDDPAMYEPAAAVYKFPPLYALVLIPLVRGGVGPQLYFQHWAFQIAVYFAAVGLLIWELRPRRPALFVVLALVVSLNLEPFFETLWKQQVETPLLLLLVLGLIFTRRRADQLAGGMIGIASMLKIYPAVLLAYFAFRRRWWSLAGFVVAVLLTFTATLIVFGVHENEAYFLKILPRMMAELPEATSENLSFGRYVQTLAGLGPVAAKGVVQILGAGMLVTTFFAVRRVRTPEDEALAYGAIVPLALLVMPNSWVSYQMLLLVPLLALLAVATSGPRAETRLLFPVLAACALMLFYWPCADAEVGWPCAQTPYFLGMVRLPRGFHEFMVDTRVLTTLVTWAATLFAIGGRRRDLLTARD